MVIADSYLSCLGNHLTDTKGCSVVDDEVVAIDREKKEVSIT